MADSAAPVDSKQWNTRQLPARLGVDVACAATAAGLVAPLIMTVDKCIIENASGKRSLGESIKASVSQLVLRPHRFFTSRPLLLIFMVYGSTYTFANTLDTYMATTRNRPASTTTSGMAKFTATSAANVSLSLVKDSQFTKMFGTVSARPIPPVTYALFMARDALTIFASFNVPHHLAPRLPISDDFARKYMSRTSAAQFIAPALMQFASTPLHLLGLDLYNRAEGTTLTQRLTKVGQDWLKSSLARMARIIPAFGIGGVVNNNMRTKFMQRLE